MLLGAATAAAIVYFVVAPHLPAASSSDANDFLAAATGLLIVAALVVFALVLRRTGAALVIVGAAAAGTGALLTALSAPEAASPFKALLATAAGFGLARLIFSPLIVYAAALFVALVDIASVSAGPARYLIEEQPRAVDYLTLFVPDWGSSAGSQLGISDLLFMAVYLDTVWSFGLRRRLTALALMLSFVGSLSIAFWLDVAMPALPLLSLALLAPNADIVWSNVRAGLRG